jgi:signal transduction histidine kinase
LLSEQVVFVDAKEALAAIVDDRQPDPERFDLLIGAIVQQMAMKFPRTRIFGELVDILWGQGEFEAAQRLENLWKVFLTDHSNVSVMSAYSTAHPHGTHLSEEIQSEHRDHSEIIPAEDSSGFEERDRILKTIGMLELRTLSLKMESQESATDSAEFFQQAEIQTGKLAVLGELSAGLVHELRNPLTIINLAIHRLLTAFQGRPADDDGHKEVLFKSLKNIDTAATRMAKIMRDVQFLSKESRTNDEVFSVSDILLQALEAVVDVGGCEGIDFRTQIGDGALMAVGDSSKILQVFVNILTNAKDAIQNRHHGSGGSLLLRVQKRDSELEVVISDNGTGMPPEVVDKIFTPFFTTKEAGRGTGIGLSIALGIINDHGGNMECRSKLGEGTQFTIRLPHFTPAA